MTDTLRVAFFPDAFDETNGVARTCRALTACAARRQFPLLCIRAGPTTAWRPNATTPTLQIARGPIGFALERDLRHDLLLWRHTARVTEAVRAFGATLIHVTGPSDVGQLGALVAHRLGLPLVASWHTNVHEYAARRLHGMLRWLPPAIRTLASDAAERASLAATLRFYRLAAALLAPNPELVDLLQRSTGAPTFVMRRGVDTRLFSPARRTVDDDTFRLGYVGRLSREKNVRLLPIVERAIAAAGRANARFVIVGDGAERPWLERQMPRAMFSGVLHGESLAEAYANMDLLIFPSETDTFGNVVQEALASGTPAVVSARGGPRFIVRPGVTGFVAADERAFIEAAIAAIADRAAHRRMREAARQQALGASWESVFDEVLLAYETVAGGSHGLEARAS